MPIKVILSNDIAKLDKQIKALKAVISKDNPKDKAIHKQALKEIQEHRKKLLNWEGEVNGN